MVLCRCFLCFEVIWEVELDWFCVFVLVVLVDEVWVVGELVKIEDWIELLDCLVLVVIDLEFDVGECFVC